MFWFYVALATSGFTFLLGYMAFCGLRQYVDDAQTGARVKDLKTRPPITDWNQG